MLVAPRYGGHAGLGSLAQRPGPNRAGALLAWDLFGLGPFRSGGVEMKPMRRLEPPTTPTPELIIEQFVFAAAAVGAV